MHPDHSYHNFLQLHFAILLPFESYVHCPQNTHRDSKIRAMLPNAVQIPLLAIGATPTTISYRKQGESFVVHIALRFA
jgi:hypothetical protein